MLCNFSLLPIHTVYCTMAWNRSLQVFSFFKINCLRFYQLTTFSAYFRLDSRKCEFVSMFDSRMYHREVRCWDLICQHIITLWERHFNIYNTFNWLIYQVSPLLRATLNNMFIWLASPEIFVFCSIFVRCSCVVATVRLYCLLFHSNTGCVV